MAWRQIDDELLELAVYQPVNRVAEELDMAGNTPPAVNASPVELTEGLRSRCQEQIQLFALLLAQEWQQREQLVRRC